MSLLHDPLADQARSQNIVGPYNVVKGLVGFQIDRKPTEEEAVEALRWLAGLKEMTDWYLVTWLGSLPKDYGRTYWLAQEYFPEYRQKTLENMRVLGVKLRVYGHPIYPQVFISHYLCAYTWYESVTPGESLAWIEKLVEILGHPNSQGRTWSVKQLSDEIRKDKGLLASSNPSDDDHQLMTENHKLRGELVTTQAELRVAEETLREVIPLLQEHGAQQAAGRLIELVNAGFQARPSPWKLTPVQSGHDLIYEEETPIGVISTRLWEGLPETALNDLKRRLEISESQGD